MNCYCCSEKKKEDCCEPLLNGTKPAQNALQLMRSRYSAYKTLNIDYIWDTTYPLDRKLTSKKEIENWAKSNEWLKLEILNTDQYHVEFKAYFRPIHKQKTEIHHEFSTFKFENNLWYFTFD
jgi:SEC-C motif-containing protein